MRAKRRATQAEPQPEPRNLEQFVPDEWVNDEWPAPEPRDYMSDTPRWLWKRIKAVQRYSEARRSWRASHSKEQ